MTAIRLWRTKGGATARPSLAGAYSTFLRARTQQLIEQTALMTLEDEFQRACEAAVEESRQLGYVPTAWIAMMHGPGGATAAARRLLTNGDIQIGFERLIQLGRPDLTVEHAVLHEKWAPLFRESHREAARWRLQQAGIGQDFT